MPIAVPSEPKVYTTKYANFRGVDYTNDPSNVWYRRSPCGVNMLPDLDGQPFKRNGWKVEFTPDDFEQAVFDAYEEYDPTETYVVGDICKHMLGGYWTLYRCNTLAEAETWTLAHWTRLFLPDFTQYKVDYFELGGIDYLFFYTSYGCFYYDSTLTFITKSWEVEVDGYQADGMATEKPLHYRKSVLYRAGDYCYTYDGDGNEVFHRRKTDMSAPEATYTATNWYDVAEDDCWKPFPRDGIDIDYSKSFFFEGGGRAAYYLFVRDTMFWFDGTKLHEAHPYIPTVLTMCDASGTGTNLDDMNILTGYHSIEYTCEGGATTDFTIPDGYANDGTNPIGISGVYIMESNGDWTLLPTSNYDWTVLSLGSSIRIIDPNNGNAKPAPETAIAQNNLKIVYETATSLFTTNVETTNQTTLQIKKFTYIRTRERRTKTTQWADVPTTRVVLSTTYQCGEYPTYQLVNPVVPIDAVAQHLDGTWQNASEIVCHYNAYGRTMRLGPASMSEAYSYAGEDIPSTSVSRYSSITYNGDVMYRYRTDTIMHGKKIPVRIQYTQCKYSDGQRGAFFSASKSLVYGNGIINQVFFTASTAKGYNTRVWYSAATNPYYFPDTNYIEVGATDKAIMGLIRVGDYLGAVKQGGNTDASVYLAYATSFDDITTYAVKQSVNGIGAVSNGAFNILNDEPLFLSAEGVMGIEPAENEERKLRNRSYYINKKLQDEQSLGSAFSFVYGGMYWLCVNGHCYVLDGSQKSSWENTKTNLQYECYYLENIPAKCFARKDDRLWFIDGKGNACRFRDDSDALRFVDDYYYSTDDDDGMLFATTTPTDMKYAPGNIVETKRETTESSEWTDALRDDLQSGVTLDVHEYIPDAVSVNSITYHVVVDGVSYDKSVTFSPSYPTQVPDSGVNITGGQSFFSDIPNVTDSAEYQIEFYYCLEHETEVDDFIFSTSEDKYYTATAIGDDVTVSDGIPVTAVWGTIADDDNSANYYKKLQKKGSLVALMPMSDSGVRVSIIPDEKDPIFVGETEVGSHVLPFNYYLKKKVKKYKRLQIVCENNSYNDGFGIDEIIKCYTLGSYAKR